jgi:succinate dehydrogenase / fumarate reductase membrane anchor subunit
VSSARGVATRHWRNQRVTSIALLPLGLWFLLSLLRQPALDHATIAAWLGKPVQALLAALLGAAMLWHSLQGVEVVLEDYVRGRALAVSLRVSQLLHAAAAVALAVALVALVRGGPA